MSWEVSEGQFQNGRLPGHRAGGWQDDTGARAGASSREGLAGHGGSIGMCDLSFALTPSSSSLNFIATKQLSKGKEKE